MVRTSSGEISVNDVEVTDHSHVTTEESVVVFVDTAGNLLKISLKTHPTSQGPEKDLTLICRTKTVQAYKQSICGLGMARPPPPPVVPTSGSPGLLTASLLSPAGPQPLCTWTLVLCVCVHVRARVCYEEGLFCYGEEDFHDFKHGHEIKFLSSFIIPSLMSPG